MSQANVVPVRHLYDAMDRDDVADAMSVFSPDIEFDVSHDVWADLTGGGHYNGLAGVAKWWQDLTSAWEDGMEMRCEEIFDAGGDQAISVATMRGRGRTSGIAVEHHHAGLWRIREGKVVRVVWFTSRDEAVAAAEPPE